MVFNLKTYLVKIYYEDVNVKVKEFVFRCDADEIDDFTKKEVEIFKKNNGKKITDVMIFEKIKDYK